MQGNFPIAGAKTNAEAWLVLERKAAEDCGEERTTCIASERENWRRDAEMLLARLCMINPLITVVRQVFQGRVSGVLWQEA